MAQETIGDRQDELRRWYAEWLEITENTWADKSPESLLSYFVTRCGVELGPL